MVLSGARFQLPVGTQRRNEKDWEEVTLPISQRAAALPDEQLVAINDFDEFARPGTSSRLTGAGHHDVLSTSAPYGSSSAWERTGQPL